MPNLKNKISGLLMSLLMIMPVFSAEHVVLVYSFSPTTQKINVFEPEFLKIAVGDSVRFVHKDPEHDSVSLKGLIPDGVKPWKSPFETDIVVTFDIQGVYAYECAPHFFMGMAGVIQVGDVFTNKESFIKNMQRFNHKGGQKIQRIIAENF